MLGEYPVDFIEDAKGNPQVAPERFKDWQEIAQTCNTMLAADGTRAGWRASVDGLINGNPVYKLKTLKDKGQGWRSRVNYRGAEGAVNSRQTAFYDLVTEVEPCVDLCLDYGQGSDQLELAQKLAANFTWLLLTGWRSGFDFHVQLQQLEMLKHGLGFHVWPGSPDNFIPRTPLNGQILFPDGANLNIEEDLDYFMLRDFLPGFAIYRQIENEKQATALGWNVKGTWSALAQSSKNKQRADNRWSPELFQREMKSGDIGTSQSHQSGLWLNTLFCREVETGRISQYTVAEGVIPKNRGKGDDPFSGCLFRKRNRFNTWPLVMFPFDMPTGGLISACRGFGARTKDYFELENRITNSMVDQVLMGSRMNVKQVGDTNPQQLRLMVLSMMNIIPKGVEPITGLQFPPLAQGPIALLQELKNSRNDNNESYAPGAPEPLDRETAKSFTMRSQNQGQLSKGSHSMYSGNYRKFLERTFRTVTRPSAAIGNTRSAQLVRQFLERCRRDNIPTEAFSRVYEVKEVLSTGAGSAGARIEALMTLMKFIYPTTTESKKINIERDLVSHLVTRSKVDRYARSHDENDMPTSDTSLAVQENNSMAQGGDALAASSQDHVQHLQQHQAKASEIAQAALQGQMDPAQGLVAIQQFGKHEGQHLNFLQSNPLRKAEYDAFHAQWLALGAIADKLEQQVKANRAAAARTVAPQAQISDTLRLGLAKTAVDERVGMAKLASQQRIDLSRLGIEARTQDARTAIQAAASANRTNGANGA